MNLAKEGETHRFRNTENCTVQSDSLVLLPCPHGGGTTLSMVVTVVTVVTGRALLRQPRLHVWLCTSK